MSCALCTSADQVGFPADMASGSLAARIWTNPIFLHTRKFYCLDCGFSQFTLPESELRVLRVRIRASTAA
jgi:hypothetical protein